MAQLGIYGFGAMGSLSVEAGEIAHLVRGAGLPDIADRIARLSTSTRQAGRNVQYMTTAVVPLVEAAVVQGQISGAPVLGSDFTAETIAQTLELRTMVDAVPDLVTRYHRAVHQAAPLPQSAQTAFRQAAALAY